MFYVYVLKNKNRETYYIGYTEDLRNRLKQHQRKRECFLVYYEAYLSSELARSRERKLKEYGGAWRSLRKRVNI